MINIFKIFCKSSKKVVIQTETTGFSPKEGNRLVEIAAIEIDENDIQTGKVFHVYINPKRDVPEDIVAIHGLDYNFLKNYPTFEAYKNAFLNFVKGKELIGYCINFDLGFLANEAKLKFSNKTTDILTMGKKAFPDQKNNLSALKERLKIEIKNPPYNGALLDVLFIYEIYKKLKN